MTVIETKKSCAKKDCRSMAVARSNYCALHQLTRKAVMPESAPSPMTVEQVRHIVREEIERNLNEERRRRINRGRALGAQL